MYYVGFDYFGVYNLPVAERLWFVRRLQSEMKKGSKDKKEQSMDTPLRDTIARAAPGRLPAKARRF